MRLALGALGCGLAVGVSVQALVTFGVRTIQPSQVTEGQPELASPPALLLLVGTLAGMVAAGVATATLLAPVRNIWRQAMLGFVAAFGSFALAVITLPVDRAFGREGLFVLSLVAGAAAFWAGRRLRRGPS